MEVITPAMGSRQYGFSLLELMVTLTVLGILVAIAVPTFGYLAANTKMKGASSDLHLTLLKARSEAVKRSANVTITATNDADWAGGWSISVGATVLLVQEAIQGVRITPQPNPLDDLIFLPSGRLRRVGLANDEPTFLLEPASRNRTEEVEVELDRCISLQPNGSPYVASQRPWQCP